jgi:hypothetical protein
MEEGQLAASVAVEQVQEPPRLPAWPRIHLSTRTLKALPYVGAAVSYVTIGVFVPEFLLSWIVAFAWLLAWTWGLPAAVRRLRR